jgi:putative CocE/NonD family hydrolase
LRTAGSLVLGLALAIESLQAAPHTLVLERNVEARMRDGIVLRADVLRPDVPGRFPAILIRTPYGKESEWREDSFPLRAARQGYVVVAQDVRGRYRSQGEFDPYRQEGRDGYDTIEWVASLPYCDGNVGMAGLSYPGAVQWLAAVEQPPHLKAIAPAMVFSTGRLFFYFGGAWDLSWISWFYLNIAPDERVRRGIDGPMSEAEAAAAWSIHGDEWLRFLPLAELPALTGVAPAYFDWLSHPDDGPYWDFARIESKYDQVRVPTLNLSGWHDEGYGPVGAVRNFNGTRDHGSRLILGPWTHGTPTLTRTTEGELDFGVNAGLDYDELLLRWFDRWLRGTTNGVDEEPPVRLFVMGDNRWRDEHEWPLARTEYKPFYLRADGRLAEAPPVDDEPPDRYAYDPLDPVVDPHGGVQGPYDQSPLEGRDDVLVYSTEPLRQAIEVTGPIEVELFASSSARDTDFVVRLLDVHPDGKAYNLMSPTLEVLRARYRESEDHPQFLAPGAVERFRLRNMMTSNVFQRGHRIRIHVTSSLFPHFDRNLNTGEPFARTGRTVPAEQAVYHSAKHPSRVILPIIPR